MARTQHPLVVNATKESAAKFTVSSWAEGMPMLELIVEDLETQARIRVDLSTSQARQLAAALSVAELETV